MEDYFFTVSGSGESLYKEKGSKFIGLTFRVKDEEEVKEVLEEVKKKYYDARHHCYGYILDEDKYRANDDGEPNHSAGDPILGQIRSKKLQQVLVVVVRYFGGTKLGVSGLINAYKTAAFEALENTKLLKVVIEKHYSLHYGYELTNEVMKLLSDFEVNIIDQNFTDTCRAKVGVRQSLAGEFEEECEKTQGLEIEAN
ncbi:YigZ family protein [Marivirga sp. S37H4]|uniref:YigZ family protein n=1 Tax=Marivirga aurantiaca TaxID=2802615 RepID=A0A934WVQ1_9BACT|nr:YigZ family protein [Marivirga aurantiaca]MBK6263824.1 YigZ family protein [Marivirga aurantiaca]